LIGVYHERFAVGRQAGAGSIAHEQGAAQLAFEFLHPRGDRGLGDVELLGGRRKTAVTDDFQESAGEIDVHGAADVGGAVIVKVYLAGDGYVKQ
jgi:hypothetical protein